MDKYMEIKSGCKLYDDYFDWVNNHEKIKQLWKSIKEKYGLEATAFYPFTDRFKIEPTENDEIKFGSMLKKTSYGEFKKNTEISKEWVSGVKEIGRIRKPQLIYYFSLLGHRWKESLFHIGEKLYCSIESDGEVSVPFFAVEMKASEFYKIVEDAEDNKED